MAEVRYVPATRAESWRVALVPGTIVALPPNVSVPTVEAVWRRLGDRGIGAVIEALTGAFGTSLAAIPDFLLAIVEGDGVRVAVRGPVELVVETPDGAEAVSGAGVATWVERHLPGAVRVSAGLASSADEGSALPIVEGIVAVDAMTLMLGSGRPVATRSPGAQVQTPPGAQVQTPPRPPAPRTEAPVAAGTPAPQRPDAATPADADDVSLWGDTIARPAQTAAPLRGATNAATNAAANDPANDPANDGDTAHDIGEAGVAAAAPDIDEPASGAPADDATIVSLPRPNTGARAGDHDGETIAVADIRGLRRGGAEDGDTDRSGGADDDPAIEATAIVPARQLARGRIRVSDGQVVELERTVIIGRRPRSPRAAGDTLPTLVAVESPEQDISRNHLEIRAEGEHVLAVDLDTTNGTVLLRGGNDPVRLHPNEPTMIVAGDTLDLGDGITIEFEDLP